MQTEIKHLESGKNIATDAPKDNSGLGLEFIATHKIKIDIQHLGVEPPRRRNIIIYQRTGTYQMYRGNLKPKSNGAGVVYIANGELHIVEMDSDFQIITRSYTLPGDITKYKVHALHSCANIFIRRRNSNENSNELFCFDLTKRKFELLFTRKSDINFENGFSY